MSPGPWTVGGSLTTLVRTPRRANGSAASERARGEPGLSGSGAWSSVPSRPGVSTVVPEVATNGLSVPSIARAIASTARSSTRVFSAYAEKSWMNAVWMTPSAARAPAARVSGSVTAPRWTSTPTSRSLAAEASLRARPSTLCPWDKRSWTTAEPMNPVAPVTNTRMGCLRGGATG